MMQENIFFRNLTQKFFFFEFESSVARASFHRNSKIDGMLRKHSYFAHGYRGFFSFICSLTNDCERVEGKGGKASECMCSRKESKEYITREAGLSP